MSQLDSSFFIAAKDKDAALQAIKGLAGKGDCVDYLGNGNQHKHFSWVNDDSEFLDAGNLEEAMDVFRWTPETDSDGNIINVSFEGEKIGSDAIFFAAIAPFVKDGSFIKMGGEDSAVWKWVFDNGKVKDIYVSNRRWEEECAANSYNGFGYNGEDDED
jgi:hypothetical protein